MPKGKKKELGRPLKRPYPPRVDATPEDIAQAMFSLPAGRKWEYMEAGPDGPVYRCADCERGSPLPGHLVSRWALRGLPRRCHNLAALAARISLFGFLVDFEADSNWSFFAVKNFHQAVNSS